MFKYHQKVYKQLIKMWREGNRDISLEKNIGNVKKVLPTKSQILITN